MKPCYVTSNHLALQVNLSYYVYLTKFLWMFIMQHGRHRLRCLYEYTFYFYLHLVLSLFHQLFIFLLFFISKLLSCLRREGGCDATCIMYISTIIFIYYPEKNISTITFIYYPAKNISTIIFIYHTETLREHVAPPSIALCVSMLCTPPGWYPLTYISKVLNSLILCITTWRPY